MFEQHITFQVRIFDIIFLVFGIVTIYLLLSIRRRLKVVDSIVRPEHTDLTGIRYFPVDEWAEGEAAREDQLAQGKLREVRSRQMQPRQKRQEDGSDGQSQERER